MRPQDVKITTTSGFDNAEITEYFYPITAHVVIGMNFFKDFFSGFTDFFGGKSSSYQNTLRSINQEVIKELQKKAHAIGANCVLALKIDNDEISAQNKSMLMVTAMGTAARANFNKKQANAVDFQKIDAVSNEQMIYLKKRKEYLQKFGDKSIEINESFWSFAKTNQEKEFAEPLLNTFLSKPKTVSEIGRAEYDRFKSDLLEFYQSIDNNFLEQIIYAKLQDDIEPHNLYRITFLIESLSLSNFEYIKELLQSDVFYHQKNALQAMKADKQQYTKDDIEKMDELINLISMQFLERGEITSKKKALSSKEKEIWICECGKENNMETTYCENCHKNIFGFGSFEFKPQDAVEKLINEVELLRGIMS